MIDTTKRKLLQMIGGASAVAAMPALASAECFNSLHKSSSATNSVAPVSAQPAMGLSVDITAGDASFVTLSNTSQHAITVKHVYPGIVHAGSKTFDINSVLAKGGLVIEPGTKRRMPINTTAGTQTETDFPRHLYRNLPQRAVSVIGTDLRGQFVNSTRSLYS